MKVAVVFHDLDASAGGGYTFQETLRAALEELGPGSRHEFTHHSAGKGRPAMLAQRGLEMVRDVQDQRLGTRALPAPSALDRTLRKEGADLVWFASSYAEDTELPFIFTIWDIEYLRQPWYPEVSRGGEWERRDRYYNRYIPKATRVIVPNAAGTEQVLRNFRVDRDRILELPHPTPPLADAAGPPEDDEALRADLGVTTSYVFYPAQFWPHKDHAVVIDALTRIDGLYAVFCGGDKGSLDAVRDMARDAGVDGRVHFLGFVEPAVLAALYRSADALVYPSRFGPENLPPLEAFSLGCPVVAADVPGAREQMGDAAVLFPPGDVDALVAGIGRARDERERLAAAGRARAAELTPERYVEGVIEFLDEFERVRRSWA